MTMAKKSPHELYGERVKRTLDAAAMQVPDRVPVFGPYQKYPYQFAGVTFQQAMNGLCLRMACAAGLTSAIVNPHSGPVVMALPAADVLLGRDRRALGFLKAYRARAKEKTGP